MLISFIAYLYHNCTYNSTHRDIQQQFMKIPFKRQLKGISWSNIRIYFDYRYMNGTHDDELTCINVGQSVKWQSTQFTCSSADILNSSHIKAAVETMENVRIFLQKLLKVIPLDSPISVTNYNGWTNYKLPFNVLNVDLYMGILSRPYGENSNIVASAGSNIKESTFYRPIHGAVFLNPRFIPTIAQSENSTNNAFFYVCIHEIFHALGIGSDKFELFHPYENSTRYSPIYCSLNKSGKIMKFIITPYAHLFATKQFGTEIFIGDNGTCPSGIEIEDGGGLGTSGNHLEGRTYMTELMTGATIQSSAGPFNRLTDASLALLQDSGNYKVDWSMGQPLVWGNSESINDKPIKDFAYGSPSSTFPSNYIYDFKSEYNSYTGFNYKYYGPTIPKNQWNCSNSSSLTSADAKEYCAAKDFYNPYNEETIGAIWVYDFMPFIYPLFICGNGEGVIQSTVQDINICGTYKCEGYESFTIEIPIDREGGKTTLKCDSSNAGVKVSGKIYDSSDHSGSFRTWDYWCPPPERFCRSVKLHEMHFKNNPFLSYTKQLEDVSEASNQSSSISYTEYLPHTLTNTANQSIPITYTTEINSNNESGSRDFWSKKKWIIIGIVIAIAILIIIIIIITLIAKKHKIDEPENDENSNDDGYLV